MPEFAPIVEESSREAGLLKHELDDLWRPLFSGAAAALLAEIPEIIVRTYLARDRREGCVALTQQRSKLTSTLVERISGRFATSPGLSCFLRDVHQAFQVKEVDNPLVMRLAAEILPNYVDALTRIYAGASPFRNGLQRFFSKHIWCHQTVDDLVSETLFRAFRGIRDERPPIKPAFWLARLARNVRAHHFRGQPRSRLVEIPDDSDSRIAGTVDLSSRITLREYIKTVKDQVGKIEALACRLKIRGYTDKEVGMRLHCSQKTISRDLERIRKFACRKWGIVPPPEHARRRKRGRSTRTAPEIFAY